MVPFFFISVLLQCIVIIANIGNVCCWDTSDFELFDLVEEVGRNFYEVLGLEQTATASDVRKAYRRLSIQYHPDKNKDPGAEETFRKIAAVADVLKNDEKRKKYDLVLQTGLPDWRQPVFYYRHVRKMGLWELTVFLFVLATLGQYLLAWSVYWEKKYELEEVLISRLRKKDKKPKKNKYNEEEGEAVIAEHIRQIPKPRYQDLLPIRLIFFLVHLMKSAPVYYQQWREFRIYKEEPVSEEEPDDEERDKFRKPRKKNKVHIPDYSCIFQPVDAPLSASNENDENSTNKMEGNKMKCETSNQSKQWTEKELAALSKAMKKYPGGTTERWEKISQSLGCSVQKVTAMAKYLRSSFVKQVPTSLQGVTGTEAERNIEGLEENVFRKNFKEDSNEQGSLDSKQHIESKDLDKEIHHEQQHPSHINDDTWSQHQQRALELALQQFHKGIEDRWDRISKCVPGKTKEECMLRYKVLVDLVKRRKMAKTS